MKLKIQNFFIYLKAAIFDDRVDMALFFGSLIIGIVDYFIWKKYLDSPDVYIFVKSNVYPMKFLAIIFCVNTVLAIFAHDKEKEIGYLVFIGNVIVAALILVLEIFYLTNK